MILFLKIGKTMTKKSNYGIPLLLNVFLMCVWGGVKGGKFYKLDIWFSMGMNSVHLYYVSQICFLKLSGSSTLKRKSRKKKNE